MLETILDKSIIFGAVAIVVVMFGFILFMLNFSSLKKNEEEYHELFIKRATDKFREDLENE